MQRHDYAGADSLRARQGLVQRIWSPRCRWHVGDLVWGRCAIPGAAADFRTALWFDGDQAVGWGWAEVPGYLSWVVDPAMPEVAAEVLSWFEGVAESAELTTTRARGLPPPSDGWTITTRSALLEPIGGAPAYRRLGLARAANLAVLRAFREAGATSALVGPRGDDAYPVPARLYRAIGFEPGARTVTYHRPG